MSKYPMTYDDYKNKIIELFLESKRYTDATNEEKLIFLNEELLVDNPEFIKGLYKDTCYDYNHYSKEAFTNEKLLANPVMVLEMVY